MCPKKDFTNNAVTIELRTINPLRDANLINYIETLVFMYILRDPMKVTYVISWSFIRNLVESYIDVIQKERDLVKTFFTAFHVNEEVLISDIGGLILNLGGVVEYV